MMLAILQARVSSSRLPGKVLKPILGVPMLIRQIERVMRCKMIDRLLVATSTDPTDDPLEQICRKNNVLCFRGSLDDVLDRFYQAALVHKPEHIVRLTGDCPLTDPILIDQIIQFYLQGGFDYVSNAIEPTFPDGLDVEIFSFSTLETAWKEATLPSEREHVTPYIYRHGSPFKMSSFKRKRDLSYYRWTVDEPRDFELVEAIYKNLYPINPRFSTEDILDLLKRKPELVAINQKIKRNEGYQKSLEGDRKVSS